ncbi:MAG TPA: hypothetical protein VFA09_12350 [Ktedonobacteraceae bacterium]|jgi:hypothetical protein|nr:hypothetical protein [Ktedonobacteraceae bacterium]
MVTRTAGETASKTTLETGSFERFASICAILAGIGSLLYGIAFVVLKNGMLSSLFLMLGGLLSTVVLTAVYRRVRTVNESASLWMLLLGIAGAFGALLHGGYDLANAINAPNVSAAIMNLPSAVDPRGLLTFGVTGIAVIILAWLIGSGGQLPRVMSYWGYLLGVLLVILYLGRLIILNPQNPLIAVDALLCGFVLNPVWYIALGWALWRGWGKR